MQLEVSAFGLSDVGLVRQRNEDVWGELPEQHLYVLADGMGGHRAGDVAARESVGALLHLLGEMLGNLPEEAPLSERKMIIRLAFEEVNRIIYHLGKTDESLRGMGTTLCCVHLTDNGLIYAHVGDSRIYRLRKEKLVQLTEDHSLLRELVSSGQLAEDKSGEFLYKNIITKAIGTEPIVEPSVSTGEPEAGDLIMICSDGLSDLLTSDEVEVILKQATSLDTAAHHLVSAAKDRGGHDNVTVVLIQLQAQDASDLS